MRLALNYTIFALLATMANIGSQELSLRAYSGMYAVTVSILAGTAVGLVVKYSLDKKYIFQFQVRDAVHDTRTFVLYTVMGIITTGVFWAFEFGFNHVFETKGMRYLGGIIGLAIGYYIKYQLDRRFVFITEDS